MKSSVVQDSSNLKISIFWGDILYDTHICRPNESVTIGKSQKSTFVIDLDPQYLPEGFRDKEGFTLIEMLSDNSADIHFNDEMNGHLRVGKELLSFSSAKTTKHVTKDDTGIYHARITNKDKADFVIGHVSFYIDWTNKVEIVPGTPLLTKRNLLWTTAMLLGFLLLAFVLYRIEPEEPEKPPERLVTLLPRNAPAKAALGERQTDDGGAQKGEAGKAELKAPEKPSAVANLQKANLGSLVSGLTSLGANSPSTNTKPAVKAPIAQAGTGGFTTQGLKQGAGGKTVGIGRTVGQGEGGFEGTGRLGLSGNAAVEGGSGYGDGATTEGGGLDRDVIESIIHRRLDRIRLCYERQLNFNPKLAGKVSIHFVIGKTGNVISNNVIEDTMKNAAVKSCILSEVKTWTFPAPEGGTLVNVDYPFVFESSSRGQ